MRFNLCVLLILICFSCSKNDRETYKYLKTFYDSEIEIPSNLMRENYTVRDVQTLFVLRGQEAALYRATAVVLLETRRIDPAYLAESSPTSIKTIGIQPLGYQIPRSFDSVTSLTTGRQGTYYWNPCIRTDAQGHADIVLPELPEGCYFRLVGQTLDGRWFAHRIIH